MLGIWQTWQMLLFLMKYGCSTCNITGTFLKGCFTAFPKMFNYSCSCLICQFLEPENPKYRLDLFALTRSTLLHLRSWTCVFLLQFRTSVAGESFPPVVFVCG